MRILYVTQVRLDEPHGGARHVHAVVQGLARRGHGVTVVAPGRDPEPVHGPRWRRVRPGDYRKPGARMEALLAGLSAKVVAERLPQVAYVRISPSSSIVPFTLRRLGVAYLAELNGRSLEELRKAGAPPWKITGAQLTLRSVCRRAACVVAVADNIAEHARTALGASQVEVVENGADVSTAVPGDRDAARRRLGIDPNRTILVFAGSLVPELRLDLLVEAVRCHPEWTLLVAGDGPQRPILEAAAKATPDRIRYLGKVPHDEAVTLLQAADLGVSVRDGDLGMKPFEMAAVGRRMVLLDVPGAQRIADLYPRELHAVSLVRERTPEGLARSIEMALTAEREAPLPREVVDSVRREVGWDRAVDRIEALLRSCAG